MAGTTIQFIPPQIFCPLKKANEADEELACLFYERIVFCRKRRCFVDEFPGFICNTDYNEIFIRNVTFLEENDAYREKEQTNLERGLRDGNILVNRVWQSILRIYVLDVYMALCGF